MLLRALPSSLIPIRGLAAGLAMGLAAALATGAMGCGNTFSPPLVEPEVVASAGQGQEAEVRAVLEEELEVRATDRFGRPAVGVPVVWEPLDGGTLEEADSATDQEGAARAAWRLGPRAGEQRLRAKLEGFGEVEFAATGHPGPTVAVDVDVQAAPGGAVLGAHPLVILSVDFFFNETGEQPVHGWVSSDPAVATVEDGELVIGAEGTASLESEGDLPWQHHIFVHVRQEGVLLLNGWRHQIPASGFKWDPAAEGRPGRAVIQGTGMATASYYMVREGAWEPTEEGAAIQAVAQPIPGIGGVPATTEVSFRAVLFPLVAGDHLLEVEYYPLAHDDPWAEWTFPVTVPE